MGKHTLWHLLCLKGIWKGSRERHVEHEAGKSQSELEKGV